MPYRSRGGYGSYYRAYEGSDVDPLAAAINSGLEMGMSVNREMRERRDMDAAKARQTKQDQLQQDEFNERKRLNAAAEAREAAEMERDRQRAERDAGQKMNDQGYYFVPSGPGTQAILKGPTKLERDETAKDAIARTLAGTRALETARARGLDLPDNATGAQAVEAMRVADLAEKAKAEKAESDRRVDEHRRNRLIDAAVPLKDPNAIVLRRAPASVGQAYVENTIQISKIDDAIAAVEKNPGAIGWKGFLPGKILNTRKGPTMSGGVDTRAGVADIGSLLIHDRSGAAVTVSEAPRLRPFVPLITDDSQTALTKLRRLREYAQRESEAMAEIYGSDQGYHPLPGSGAGIVVETTAPRRPRTGDVIR